MARNQSVAALTAKVAELEAEVESGRHEQRTFGSVFAAKERDQVRKLEALQDEVRRRAEAGGLTRVQVRMALLQVHTASLSLHHLGKSDLSTRTMPVSLTPCNHSNTTPRLSTRRTRSWSWSACSRSAAPR